MQKPKGGGGQPKLINSERAMESFWNTYLRIGEPQSPSPRRCARPTPPPGEGVVRLDGGVQNAEAATQSDHRLISGVTTARVAVTGPTGSLSQREL
jgi:hypothetical protein